MPKRIIELVREKEAQVKNNLAEAEKLGKMASAAVNQGPQSQAWADFMSQFVDKDPNNNGEPFDPGQLKRLLATDNTQGNEVLDRKRAYMLSNRMCGAGSPGATGTGAPALALDFEVDSIDETLVLGCLPAGQANPNREAAAAPNPPGEAD